MAIQSSEPDSTLFKLFAERLESVFNAVLINRLENIDTMYYDFKIKEYTLTLHLQCFVGISLFPKALNKATKEENALTAVIGYQLKRLIFSSDASTNCGNK